MSDYELNKYYVPADDDIVIESYSNCEIYEHNDFITNGIITVSKKYFPNLVCSKTPIELPDIPSARTFFDSLITNEKCKEIIEKFNTLESSNVAYKGMELYHSKKRQNVIVDIKYRDFLDMGFALYDSKTQLIYVFWSEDEDEYAELPETYDLMFIILPFDKKLKRVKDTAMLINKLEAYSKEIL